MHDWWPEGTVADVIESSEAMSDVPLPGNMIWFMLVDPNAATSCSRDEKDEKKEPSVEEEEKKDVVATVDPYIEYAIPTKKKEKKKKRSLKKKMKRRRNGAL